METRKGILTEQQEKTLDELLKLKGIPEKIDGIVIRLVDNKGLHLLMKTLPDTVKELVWSIVDMIFEVLDEIVKEK